MQFPRLKRSSPLQGFFIYLTLSILLGLIWYWLLYDRFPLYFTHVNWIYNAGGDVLQHQLGWEWFRQEPWRFPLGKIQAYGYPVGTSVTFMDAIPLFAIPFKLFSPWLERNFQYFGIWELASVIGQMLFGMLILHEITRSYPLKILGASLLVLSPPMMFRAFYHSSLSAHWILLAAIWFLLLEYRQRLWRGAWAVLFAVAVLVHVYFIPMLIPMWMVGMYFHYKNAKNGWMILLDITVVGAVVFLIGFSIGLFGLNYHSLSEIGFGLFSWNLNGFFNPFHFSSAYLRGLITGTSGQYEGFSYLGLGNLLLFPVALYLFFERVNWRECLAFLLPVSGAVVVYTLFALSNKAFWGDQRLWDIPLSSSILEFNNLFRTSGRFIWPVFYLVVLFGLFIIIRYVRFPVPVLLLALLLQFCDLQPLYESKKITGLAGYDSHLEEEFWQPAADTNRHIVILPVKKLPQSYEPIVIFAAHHHLTLNTGYFARWDGRALRAYGDQAWKDLRNGNPDHQTIYMLNDPKWVQDAKTNLADEMYICELDDYTVLFSTENALAKSNTDLTPYCLIPAR
jgi:hypothetical protein